MEYRNALFAMALALGVCACDSDPHEPVMTADAADARFMVAPHDGPYHLNAPVFDIVATPAGTILVAEGSMISEIRRNGIVDVVAVPVVAGTAINGLAPIGAGNFFASNSALDLAEGAGVWRVSRGNARLVADIEAFETAKDPDAFAGPQWKDQRCEEDPSQGFTAGPQSNPYHIVALSGHEALVADAAGNTLLSTRTDGRVDWVAVLTPPVDADDEYRVLFPLGDIDCFVQPVPTAVDIGPDGAYYVGELTGVPGIPGWSRVWRVEPGSMNVVCPSADCQEVISGLTSVMDVEFGPDGMLYVVEYDMNGWLQAIIGNPAGGQVSRCDVATGSCTVVADGLVLPGAITFDRQGRLWVLENGTAAPTVSRISLP
jgi:hypothetical protein